MSRPAFRSLPRTLLLLSSFLIHPLIGCTTPPEVPSDSDASTPVTPAPDGSTPDASTPDASTPDASTPDASTPDASTPETPETVYGLKGEYFRMPAAGNRTFPAAPDGTTLESNIDFTDLTAVFNQFNRRTVDTLARWTGQLTAPETGEYTFYAIGDNGFRLFIGGQPVIDHWVPDWDVEQTSAKVRLVKGEPRAFLMELFQDNGGANLYLRWSGPGIDRQIVPPSAFTPPAGFEVFPVRPSISEDGLKLTLDFAQRATALGELLPHLTVAADTVSMPLSSAIIDANDRSLVVVTLSEPVQRGQKVRVTFDGIGGLSVDNKAVPQFARSADNRSTHRLLTPWGEQLDRANPHPEYPRPQLTRPKWLNLNGTWEFSSATEGQQPTFGQALPQRILVPFPVESLLSGVEKHHDHMFYRRTFTVPSDWQVGSGQKLMLNFGAVDYRARVWVNGQLVKEHTGGYTAFSADITGALSGTGPQELVVAVTDTTGSNQPKGKQAQNPSGIFYTPSSGIWQTVWLEPVSPVAIDRLETTPNTQNSTLALKVYSASTSATVTAEARNKNGQVVGTISGAANTALSLPVSELNLWSPDSPYLYTLSVTLTDGTNSDTVGSYFGMRAMTIQNVAGVPKLVLNGQPIFSLSLLDQGFWPDGLNTAPSDEALRWDLQVQKDLGFNAVRKHIKVEPARWYYHADTLGLIVWQDFVSGFGSKRDTRNRLPMEAQGQQAFITEGFEMMDQLHNAPSIAGWIVFNEGWGEWGKTESGQLTDQVKAKDPSRWVNAHSGVNCCDSFGDSGRGDVIDNHDYNNDSAPRPDATRVAMDGEHGGFTLRMPGHLWPGAPTVIYSGVADKAALTSKYVSNTQTFYLGAARRELSGSVYTQVTDVENELNGLYTYDRRILKVDQAQVRDINLKVIAAGVAAGQPLTYPGKGRWTLDEGTGTVGKDSEGSSDMLLRNGATWVTGVRGKALSFNGKNSFAQTSEPVVDTLRDYSISAWVRLDSLPGAFVSAVSQDGRETANPFYLQYGKPDGQPAFAFAAPGDKRALHLVTPALNRWYHLVGVRSGNQLRLYVDGDLRGTQTANAPTESVGPLAIGRAKYGGNDVDFWPGSVDEVQAFGSALTDTQVKDLYNAQKP